MRTRLFSGLLALAVVATACGGGDGDATSDTDEPPVSASDDGYRERSTFAFYYQSIDPGEDLAKLGANDVIITNAQEDDAGAAAAIKATGAKAYRGIQVYYFPAHRPFEFIDFSTEPDLAYCKEGDEPIIARTLGKASNWYFLDANERRAQELFREFLAELVADGWDGVFFDRGFAAMTGIDDGNEELGVWNRTSTCTEDPVDPTATLADAYVAMAADVKTAGLEIMLNYGHSPFYPEVPMRPDPRDPNCVQGAFATCNQLDDVWEHVDYVLSEAPAHPKDQVWDTDQVSNRANETHPEHAGKVVGLLTTGTMGGENVYNTRESVYYQFARVRLWDMPLAINTGDDLCGGRETGLCNRFGIYPELTSLRLGRPLDPEPVSRGCVADDFRCVWTREYVGGMSIVNVSAESATLTIPISAQDCGPVHELFGDVRLSDECPAQIVIEVPGYHGRMLAWNADSI